MISDKNRIFNGASIFESDLDAGGPDDGGLRRWCDNQLRVLVEEIGVDMYGADATHRC
jgi:hypothetical protein